MILHILIKVFLHVNWQLIDPVMKYADKPYVQSVQ